MSKKHSTEEEFVASNSASEIKDLETALAEDMHTLLLSGSRAGRFSQEEAESFLKILDELRPPSICSAPSPQPNSFSCSAPERSKKKRKK